MSKWLAKTLHKNPATVSKWCNNHAQLDLKTLAQIADVLNVDIHELICHTKVEWTEYEIYYRRDTSDARRADFRLQEHSYRTEGSRQHYCRYGKCRWRHDSRRYIRQDSSYRGCQPRQGSFERDTSHSVWFLCTHHFCYDRVHALPRQRGQWQPHTDNPCPGQSSPPCQPSRWGVLAGGRQVA